MLSTVIKRKIREFRQHLFTWGRKRARNFSWRRNPTLYRILIAEFFLQRTKAPQAEKQFRLFVRRYRNFPSLREVNLQELKKYLKPLGLEKRVGIFQKLIKVINEKYGGKVPNEYDDLIKLPGIGDYSASAIEVFALNRKKPLIDANTIRIFSQLLGKNISREEGKHSALIRECALYFSSLGRDRRKANWLLLDYGSIIDKRRVN